MSSLADLFFYAEAGMPIGIGFIFTRLCHRKTSLRRVSRLALKQPSPRRIRWSCMTVILQRY